MLASQSAALSTCSSRCRFSSMPMKSMPARVREGGGRCVCEYTAREAASVLFERALLRAPSSSLAFLGIAESRGGASLSSAVTCLG